MSSIFVWKEKLLRLYAKYSIYVDKALQFVLAFAAFWLISSKIGYMKPLTQQVVTMVLAVICTFLPMVFTAITAAALVIAHLTSLSLGVAAATAAVFLVMFIFYFRFAGGTAIIALLMPLAFFLKIPYAIPIIWGLIGTPVCVIPIACGTIVYFIISYVNTSATVIKGSSDKIVQQITVYIQRVFQNREMWLAIAAFVLCLLIVYTIRRLSIDHAWEISIVCGAITNLVVMVAGDLMLDIHTEYLQVIAGGAASALLAFLVQFFVFTVDYSRTERLQFEDDEYYYYVKAVPKIQVTPPEKTVKTINERQETAQIGENEAGRDGKNAVKKEVKPAAKKPAVKKAAAKKTVNRSPESVDTEKKPAARAASKSAASERTRETGKSISDETFKNATLTMSKTEEMLLAKSLQEELDIQNIVEEELKK